MKTVALIIAVIALTVAVGRVVKLSNDRDRTNDRVQRAGETAIRSMTHQLLRQ